MSYAVLGILVALISLGLHSPGPRIGAGIITLFLFLLFVFYVKKRSSVRWRRLALALSGAGAVLGVWGIVLSILHIVVHAGV